MSKLYVGDSNSTSKKPNKSYVGYNGKSVEVFIPNEPKVYGVAWDGSATTSFTRLEDAKNFFAPNPYYAGMSDTPSSPFDNLYPWCEMKKSENADAGTVVAIPKFWYKLEYASGTTGLKLWIADKPVSGFKVSPACMNRGDGAGERDVTYVGRYHCASDYKSKTGVTPKLNVTRGEFRSAIHALGNDVWQYDDATYWTIMFSLLVEFANWNTRTTIGKGCGNNSSVENMGASDSMPYHTGTMKTSRSTYGVGVQYRNIEGLWDCCYDFVDGIRFSGTDVYSILNPSDFSDTQNGTKIGSMQSSSGYISAYTIPSDSFSLIPAAVSGSSSTYVTYKHIHNAPGDTVKVTGGANDQYDYVGTFYYRTIATSEASSWTLGSRLMVLP